MVPISILVGLSEHAQTMFESQAKYPSRRGASEGHTPPTTAAAQRRPLRDEMIRTTAAIREGRQ